MKSGIITIFALVLITIAVSIVSAADDEDSVTLDARFNAIVGGALFSAYSSGYDPVFMDIGTLRYVWTAPTDDSDE